MTKHGYAVLSIDMFEDLDNMELKENFIEVYAHKNIANAWNDRPKHLSNDYVLVDLVYYRDTDIRVGKANFGGNIVPSTSLHHIDLLCYVDEVL